MTLEYCDQEKSWKILSPKKEVIYSTGDSLFAMQWYENLVGANVQPFAVLINGVKVYKAYRGIKTSYYYVRHECGAIKEGHFLESTGDMKAVLGRLFT